MGEYFPEEEKKLGRPKAEETKLIDNVSDLFAAYDMEVNKIKVTFNQSGEVMLPTMEEWVDYIDYMRKRLYRRDGRLGQVIYQCVKEWVQERDLRAIAAVRP